MPILFHYLASYPTDAIGVTLGAIRYSFGIPMEEGALPHWCLVSWFQPKALTTNQTNRMSSNVWEWADYFGCIYI